MKTLAPVLLFVYNRPRHTERAIASLLRNKEAEASDLYIFSDAAKSGEDAAAVARVREVIGRIQGFGSVHVVERKTNRGLAGSIIEGVTSIVNRYGRVIVLEDDLVVSPFFLRFMNDALEVYKDEPRVGHIQACDFIQSPALPDTFLIKWTGSWGWATWQRAWKLFNANGQELLDQLCERGLTRAFDFNGKYGFTRMLRRQVEGKNSSWAIRWNASLFLADVLSLNVGRSLVSNEGLDGSGTHSASLDPYRSVLTTRAVDVVPISPIVENTEARKAYERYYARTNSKWAKGVRRIRRILRGMGVRV